MKNLILISLIAAGTLTSSSSVKPKNNIDTNNFSTCVGDTPCKACKNCKYCKRCAKDGLTCGVCKR